MGRSCFPESRLSSCRSRLALGVLYATLDSRNPNPAFQPLRVHGHQAHRHSQLFSHFRIRRRGESVIPWSEGFPMPLYPGQYQLTQPPNSTTSRRCHVCVSSQIRFECADVLLNNAVRDSRLSSVMRGISRLLKGFPGSFSSALVCIPSSASRGKAGSASAQSFPTLHERRCVSRSESLSHE